MGEPQLSRRLQPAGLSRPRLAHHEHEAWRRLILRRCGLDFGDTRRDYLARRLWQQMVPLGITNYGSYLNRVERRSDAWIDLLELLVNHETSFFRHRSSFEALRTVLHERLKEGAAHQINLWSAGCSTGQEPYSLAICALDSLAAHSIPATVRVTGGDVSERARAQAQEGLFTARQVATVPTLARRLYFRKEMGPRGPLFRAAESLRQTVHWAFWNLSLPETYHAEPQDVIFCQNLLIYLPKEDRREVVRRLGGCLRRGGHLFLAPGEVLGLRLPGLQSVDFPDCLVYRRTR